MAKLSEVFGRLNDHGMVDILHVEDGERVTRIEDAGCFYPLGRSKSCKYEHPEGITLTPTDAAELHIYVE